jgi:hypothetical protein
MRSHRQPKRQLGIAGRLGILTFAQALIGPGGAAKGNLADSAPSAKLPVCWCFGVLPKKSCPVAAITQRSKVLLTVKNLIKIHLAYGGYHEFSKSIFELAVF